MEKLVCPFCQKELDDIALGSPASVEWDDIDATYYYHPAIGDRECSCPHCKASLPRSLTDPVLDVALD